MATATLPVEEENYIRMSLLLTGISPRAVRVLFNREFSPQCLYSSLKKEYTKLNELKRLHRISLKQWDLLFPPSRGVPDSKTFDITLMITLLRNLTRMIPPMGGFDCLPTATETTLCADLARIKFYRNRLAHLDDAKIDHDSFITYWKDATDAIVRVGGHQFQMECDNLKNKPLDQTSHKIMLEIKRSNDEIKELKQSFESLKKEIEVFQQVTIPRNVRDDHEDVIRDWERDDETFVETRASEHVMSWLSKCNIAVVTGSSGTGKSFLIHHAALELHREKNFDIIPLSFVTAPLDIIHYKSKIRNQVFVIDDICGKATINVQFVNIWKDLTEKLKSVFQSNSVQTEETISNKLLISCRLHVFNDSQFKCLTIFTENAVDLVSESFCLLGDERKLMIQKYLKSEQINHVINHLCDFDFFPLLCKISKNLSFDKLKLLFTSPFKKIKEDIEDIIQLSKNYQLCALILCILFEEGIKEEWLKSRLKTGPITLRKKLIEIASSCNIDLERELERRSLENGFSTLLGTFLKKNGTKYSLIHDKIYDIASVVCAQTFQESFIKYANGSFIGDRYIFKSIETNTTDELIVISEEMEVVYFQRLVDDLKQRDIYSTLHNKQLVHKSFREKLLAYLNKNAEDLQDLFNQIDKNGLKVDMGEVHSWDESDNDEMDVTNDECSARDITFPLIEAATEGYVDIVDFLIKMNCNLNHIDSFDRSALYKACKGGFHDVVKILLNHGADPSLCHEDESSPLHMACQAGNDIIVQLLLAKNVDVCKLDKDYVSPLRIACEEGHINIVRLLLQNEPDVNMSDIWMNQCPLQMACKAGHLDVVKLLLENNADVNSISKFHDTPLSLACEGGYDDIVRVILENKVDVFKTIPSKSPLFIACENEHAGIVEMLLESNTNIYPDIYEWDGNVYSPLAAACARSQVNIMQMLLQKCSNEICCSDMCFSMRTASFYGCTDIIKVFMKNVDLFFGEECHSLINESMYLACKGGNIETVQYFLSQGIDVFQCSKTGRSLLHATCESSRENKGHQSVLSLLIKNRLDISKPDKNGLSPLHLACQNDLLSICDFLISNKSSVNMQDNQNRSPLHFACQDGSFSLCEFLISNKANVNMIDYHNMSPLHFACERRLDPDINIIEVLLKNKANFKLCDNTGKTPLHVICERCNYSIYNQREINNSPMFVMDISTKCMSIVKLLIGYGAGVNVLDNEGETPLHKACRYGDYELVKSILSSKKPDPNLRNNAGQTPMYLACKFSHNYITKIYWGNVDSFKEVNEGKSSLQISSETLKSIEEHRNYSIEMGDVDEARYLNSKYDILKHIISLLNEYNADLFQT
ncbi:unnamed protein product [Mytilus coruscus]|uniref:Uncharacterized protein n=1 Tax=Mytilus coruscus TaxID=42192 RepID=A0A6J8DXH6_MYTCO|nr:unnamed protein product [Mytilus coruscus]